MPKVIKFKKLRFTNPYRRFEKNFDRDSKDLPKAEAAFTMRRARSIMRKAPKRPKSRFGQQKTNKKGKTYWQKGLYSRPGQPPFYHKADTTVTQPDGTRKKKWTFNLRFILFKPISAGSVSIPKPPGTKVEAWRVGPKYNPAISKFYPKPIPALMEYGGTVHVKKNQKKGRKFTDRGLTYTRNIDQNGSGTLRYAARPYMKPASKEARVSAKAKRGGSIKRLVRMGNVERTYGIIARRKY